MNIIQFPVIEEALWFVPAEYQTRVIIDMWDNYENLEGIPHISLLGHYCENILDLAGIHYAGDAAHYYEEAERIGGGDEEIVVEHEIQTRELYEDMAGDAFKDILDHYRATHKAYGKLYHPSVKGVW